LINVLADLPKPRLSNELKARNFFAHGGFDYTRTYVKSLENRWIIRFEFENPDEREKLLNFALREFRGVR